MKCNSDMLKNAIYQEIVRRNFKVNEVIDEVKAFINIEKGIQRKCLAVTIFSGLVTLMSFTSLIINRPSDKLLCFVQLVIAFLVFKSTTDNICMYFQSRTLLRTVKNDLKVCEEYFNEKL